MTADLTTLTAKLKTCRGKGYYTVLKQILVLCGPQITRDAHRIINLNGKIRPVDIGILALKYDLNFKATCEWLEESKLFPVGTYNKIIRSGLTPGQILEAAKREAAP